jgi:hypothetical protein
MGLAGSVFSSFLPSAIIVLYFCQGDREKGGRRPSEPMRPRSPIVIQADTGHARRYEGREARRDDAARIYVGAFTIEADPSLKH